MSASVESQRLISLSLGKIAQSRGKRGGINLHKNLLVATVLHKARAAYMMENYHCFQRQQSEQQLKPIPAQTRPESPVNVSQTLPSPPQMDVVEASQPSTPVTSEVENRSTASEESRVVCTDKENHPPPSESSTSNDECCDAHSSDHLAAATQLAWNAMTSDNKLSNQQTSGFPTCNTNSVLKRRRDNVQPVHSEDCPAEKKAKFSPESSSPSSTTTSTSESLISSPSVPSSSPSLSFLLPRQQPCRFAVNGEPSPDESSESDSEDIPMIPEADTPQITNLVSIFNSGFAGLCDEDDDSEQHNSFTPIVKPEATKLIMCSSEVTRLEALHSAIMLFA